MNFSNLCLYVFFYCIILLGGKNEANQVDQLMKHHFRLSKETTKRYNNNSSFLSTYSYSSFHISLQDGLMSEDKIVELPGQPNVDFDQYGGYVTVDPKNGRALYYYFVEFPQDPNSKPLLLWLNGGPGCSSLGYGAMSENGPLTVNDDGKTLARNSYSWNKVANVLYLDYPAGTGFSYSNTSSDYASVKEGRIAADSYTFLINWLERFPQYKSRDFFIAGESYAGRMIPQLAQLILHNNKIKNLTTINLHGIAIGNPDLDRNVQNEETFKLAWSHALIPEELYQKIKDNCNFTDAHIVGEKCLKLTTDKYAQAIGEINEYNIYDSLGCNDSNATSEISGTGPCPYDPVAIYLNMPMVQKFLHANVTNLPYAFEMCSNRCELDSSEAAAPISHVIKELIANKLNVWIYSGDIDMVVPTLATRRVAKSLKLPLIKEWRPWYYRNEVGGYVEEYEGLTFVTVKGSGHMVPTDKPKQALAMITFFLEMKLRNQK